MLAGSWMNRSRVHGSRHCESLPVLLFNFNNSNENRRVHFGNGFICETQKEKEKTTSLPHSLRRLHRLHMNEGSVVLALLNPVI